MKFSKILSALSMGLILVSCSSSDRGVLTGVERRPVADVPKPYGMAFIPGGSFQMGIQGDDLLSRKTSPEMTSSVTAFYMDETEITNNEYRQFVEWTRDSLIHVALEDNGNNAGANQYMKEDPITGKMEVNWEEGEVDFREMYLEAKEAPDLATADDTDFGRLKGTVLTSEGKIDVDFVQFAYSEFDIVNAAYGQKEPDRLQNLYKDTSIAVYPDTLCIIRDFEYSYNEPFARRYFSHPAYDDYPVVGVTWDQANAFCAWRTQYSVNYTKEINKPREIDNYRLPSESEWEYAAQGGNDKPDYPWGGPYLRNSKGCLLANFKPNRGVYHNDGMTYPAPVESYWANNYGLYCMAGNVAEWTLTQYQEGSFAFYHDLNPSYRRDYDYNSGEDRTRNRKVVKGGSWSDMAYFLQTGTRSWEYANEPRSFIGFRCVTSVMGEGIE